MTLKRTDGVHCLERIHLSRLTFLGYGVAPSTSTQTLKNMVLASSEKAIGSEKPTDSEGDAGIGRYACGCFRN